MSNDRPHDEIEAEIRQMLIDVPGVGQVALGDMTPDDHRRFHDAVAHSVASRRLPASSSYAFHALT